MKVKYAIAEEEWFPVYILEQDGELLEFEDSFVEEYHRVMELFNAMQVILQHKKEKL